MDSDHGNHVRCNDSTPSSNATAMGLWQKYTQLQRTIEGCYQERNDLQYQIDENQQRQEKLREKQREERHSANFADRRSRELEEQIDQMNKEYQSRIQQAHAAALFARDRQEAKWRQWNDYKLTVLQGFLDDCAKFRSTHRHLQIASDTVGLEKATSRAWVYACANGDGGRDCLQTDEVVGRGIEIPRIDFSTEPAKWGSKPGDFELSELLEHYNGRKGSLQVVNDELDSLKRRKDECSAQEYHSSERVTLTEKQLDRVKTDKAKLEAQCHEMTELTREARMLASNFAQAIKRRPRARRPAVRHVVTPQTLHENVDSNISSLRQQPQLPTPPVRQKNPYVSKKSRSHIPSRNEASQIKKPSKKKSSRSGQNAKKRRASVQNQHRSKKTGMKANTALEFSERTVGACAPVGQPEHLSERICDGVQQDEVPNMSAFPIESDEDDDPLFASLGL